MKCEQIVEQLEAALDSAHLKDTTASTKAHLWNCRSCRSQWQQLQVLKKLLARNLPSQPGSSLDKRVMRAFSDRYQPRRSFRRWIAGLASGSILIRRPVMVALLVTVISLVVVSAMLGRVMGTTIVINAPGGWDSIYTPAPLVVEISSKQETSQREVPRKITRPSSAREKSPVKPDNVPRPTDPVRPVNNVMGASSAGAYYSSTIALKGFEAAPNSSFRILK